MHPARRTCNGSACYNCRSFKHASWRRGLERRCLGAQLETELHITETYAVMVMELVDGITCHRRTIDEGAVRTTCIAKQVFTIAHSNFRVKPRDGAMLKQERDPGLPAHGYHVRPIAFMKLCLSHRDLYFGMRNRREKRVHIFGEEILRVLCASQGRYHAMFPGLRVFTDAFFFAMQNGAGDAFLIEPGIKIEVCRAQPAGNGSEVNSMIDGAFEGQGAAALTQEERTDDDTIF